MVVYNSKIRDKSNDIVFTVLNATARYKQRDNFIHYEDANRLDLDLNFEKNPILRSHAPLEHKLSPPKLIFILRNYKDVLIRENINKYKYDPNKLLFDIKADSVSMRNYINRIIYFNNWDPTNRLLVYYEDLLVEPVKELKRVLEFLEEDIPESLNENDLLNISRKVKESYHKQFINEGGAHTKNNELIVHSKNIPLLTQQKMDAFIKLNYQEIWNYLERYSSLND